MKIDVNNSKLGKTAAAMVSIYLVALVLMPFFHLHPDNDHLEIKGSNYHSHHIPVHETDTDEPEHGDQQPLTKDFALESANMYHSSYTFAQSNERTTSMASRNQIIHHIPTGEFSFPLNNYISQRDNCNQILSPLQKQDFLLFSTNTSPPLV